MRRIIFCSALTACGPNANPDHAKNILQVSYHNTSGNALSVELTESYSGTHTYRVKEPDATITHGWSCDESDCGDVFEIAFRATIRDATGACVQSFLVPSMPCVDGQVALTCAPGGKCAMAGDVASNRFEVEACPTESLSMAADAIPWPPKPGKSSLCFLKPYKPW